MIRRYFYITVFSNKSLIILSSFLSCRESIIICYIKTRFNYGCYYCRHIWFWGSNSLTFHKLTIIFIDKLNLRWCSNTCYNSNCTTGLSCNLFTYNIFCSSIWWTSNSIKSCFWCCWSISISRLKYGMKINYIRTIKRDNIIFYSCSKRIITMS